MACGDVVPNTIYIPTCGESPVRISKSATPPDGSLIFPGDLLTWVIVAEIGLAGNAVISLEDIFNDCSYIDMGSLTASAPWTITPDGGNPCRLVLDHPAADFPGTYVCTLTAIAGNLAGDGFGGFSNTANALAPAPALGNTVAYIFAPKLVGDVGDQALGAVVNYQYDIVSGTAPFVVSLYGGALPDGLTISAGGLLSGTTTVADDFNFTLQLLDANGNTYLLSDECTVS